MFLLTYTFPYRQWLWILSVTSFMEAKAVNNPPKSMTLRKKKCEALLGRRDVLLGYVRDTPVLKLGALFEIHFSQSFSFSLPRLSERVLFFSFMIP